MKNDQHSFHGFLVGQPFDSQPVKKTMKTTSFKVSYLEKFNFDGQWDPKELTIVVFPITYFHNK